jgi:hypothetical protein
MNPESLIHEPELDMNRDDRARDRSLLLAAALRRLAPTWLERRLAPSMENPRRSLDRERQHFTEPWEENPRR